MAYLDSLTGYGTDIFWVYEKELTILWSSRSGYNTLGFESVHDALRCEFSVMGEGIVSARILTCEYLGAQAGSPRVSLRL